MTSKPTLVVLTGAGISAESGLKTFRDSDGLWEGYDVEDVATPRAFRRNPELVLRFYNERRANVREAKPNAAHIGLAALEKHFRVRIITQNIDDLHERGGSTDILHLHGEIFKMRSVLQPHSDALAVRIDSDIALGDTAPDGGQYRPHIVWFEEAVPAIINAAQIVAEADCFAVVGTSLVVYPAAGLVDLVQPGVPIYVVDKSIPHISSAREIIPIAMHATEGVAELSRQLLGR
jgi:NAD-dependent deacetylase